MKSFLIELFLYYAKFPAREGVEALFNKGRSDFSKYATLQEEVKKLPPALIPDIENYIFSSNFETVQYYVNSLTGFYLFVDYGEIESSANNVNSNVENARMAITIAYKLKGFSGDSIEQMLASDQCLAHLVQIRNTMLSEQKSCPWLKDLSKDHSLVPFGRPDLSSIGWSMLFSRKTYDMFNAKNK
jgi:hypothetical protein